MDERKIEAHFIIQVENSGGMTRKTQWVGRWGCPDRWCGWPSGRSAWVELKGSRGRLSPQQVREIGRLKECGQLVEVLSSIEEVDAFVAEMTA